MTTAIARVDDLTPDRVALLKRTLCVGLSDDEMELFAAVARRAGLDPFAKQIYATKRRSKGGPDKLTIQTGIDGFRVIAARTGELDGQDGPYWCGPDGAWRDVWLEREPPAAAKVTVFRKGCSRGFTGVARFSEYAQCYADGNLSGQWPKMPAVMIAKCAEALALRKAFPQDLSGLYTSEEMEQADEPAIETTATPTPARIQTDPPKQPQPAALPPKAEPFTVTPGDPLADIVALESLARTKGLDWVGIVAELNAKYGLKLSVTRTKWRDVSAEHRAATVEALKSLPDKVKPEPDTATTLSGLILQLSTRGTMTASEIWQKLCEAAGWQAETYDDLTVTQLKQACTSIRAKLSESKPEPAK